MTISTDRDVELTVDQICTSAMQLAGTVDPNRTPRSFEFAQARTFLDTILKELQSHGVFARSRNFVDVALTVGTYRYTLASDVLDVVGDAMYIQPGEDLTKAAGETLIQEQSRDAWQRNSSKDATGQPTLYFVNRTESPVQIWLWPIPEEAGTIRVDTHRLTADTFEGSTTVDLRQYWVKYLMYALAEMLAEAAGFGTEKISRLEKRAEKYLFFARGRANQGVKTQLVMGHGNGRRRRR